MCVCVSFFVFTRLYQKGVPNECTKQNTRKCVHHRHSGGGCLERIAWSGLPSTEFLMLDNFRVVPIDAGTVTYVAPPVHPSYPRGGDTGRRRPDGRLAEGVIHRLDSEHPLVELDDGSIRRVSVDPTRVRTRTRSTIS